MLTWYHAQRLACTEKHKECVHTHCHEEEKQGIVYTSQTILEIQRPTPDKALPHPSAFPPFHPYSSPTSCSLCCCFHYDHNFNVILFFQQLDLPVGSVKAVVLIENVLASFEMHEILYELRQHSAGLNCGIWDYSASFVNKFGMYWLVYMIVWGMLGMSVFLQNFCNLLVEKNPDELSK